MAKAASDMRFAICGICGRGPRVDDPWQADHITPVIEGGAMRMDLRLTHQSCNERRGARLAQERVSRKFRLSERDRNQRTPGRKPPP
jgi:5-methylcytosine-specific restriction endonuclease McrA